MARGIRPAENFSICRLRICRPIISISQRATGNASYNIRIKQIEKKRAAIRRAFGIFHNSNSTLFSNSELEVLRQQARAISPFQASHACIFENEGSLYALCRPPHPTLVFLKMRALYMLFVGRLIGVNFEYRKPVRRAFIGYCI